ncbi:MAG: hypothetical protein E6H00_05455 [Bacillati bacterium ANGP1]|uniref:Uncharacterized protein n=1 Tax=Candidatus Segetimicrobium genomatis TaxID=2569760 RepID=A0A537K5Q9_9BACT|nr:MAG: hypothetical protein E6H00_05455 [Terrabacteria group bacterium ANGP1]
MTSRRHERSPPVLHPLRAFGAGEVLATSTVRDLVSGSGLTFAERGAQALKGVPGEWRLYSVTG